MRKIIFLITAALFLFGFTNAFALDEDIDGQKTIYVLKKSLTLNGEKLGNALRDMATIMKTDQNEDNLPVYLSILNPISEAKLVHKYLRSMFTLNLLIDRDLLNAYFMVCYEVILGSKQDLELCYQNIQYYYPYLEIKSALHTTDKVKDILQDSLREIESALKSLSKANATAQ